MKVFISIPMMNRSEEEVRNEINRIMSVYFSKDDELIDQRIDTDNPYKTIAYSIGKIGEADIVFFANGWNKSRGCLAEKYICDVYGGKHMVFEDKYSKEYFMIEIEQGYTIRNLINTLVSLQIPDSSPMSLCGEAGYGILVDNVNQGASLDNEEFINNYIHEIIGDNS